MSDLTLPELKREILKRVNAELDVPFVGEDTEALVLGMIISPLLNKVPVRLLPLMLDSIDGLSAEEFESHVDGLADFINELVDVPYVAEMLEGRLIRVVLRSALSPLLKGESL
jgi:hypothetical protein